MGILLELSRVPLSLYAIKHVIKNWERIRNNRANCLLIESYKESSIEKFPWILNIRKVLKQNHEFYAKIDIYQILEYANKV